MNKDKQEFFDELDSWLMENGPKHSIKWINEDLSHWNISNNLNFTQALTDFIESKKAEWQREAKEEERKRCRDIILRRTEIPKDARNPTRDSVVVLGEELCNIIDNEGDTQ